MLLGDVLKLQKLRAVGVCAERRGNTIGEKPENVKGRQVYTNLPESIARLPNTPKAISAPRPSGLLPKIVCVCFILYLVPDTIFLLVDNQHAQCLCRLFMQARHNKSCGQTTTTHRYYIVA